MELENVKSMKFYDHSKEFLVLAILIFILIFNVFYNLIERDNKLNSVSVELTSLESVEEPADHSQ